MRQKKAVLLELLVLFSLLSAGEAWMRADLCERSGERDFARVRERFLSNPLSLAAKRVEPATPISPERAASPVEGINALGYRGPAVSPYKPWGLLRVVCLGGSSVYGTANSSWRAAWPTRLQKVLSGSTRAEVLNGGVPGYQVHQSLERFEKLFVELAPDAAILCNTCNDIVTSRAQRMGYYAGDVVVASVDGALPSLLSRSALGLRLLATRTQSGNIFDDGAADAAGPLRPVSAAVQDREARNASIEQAREVDGRRQGSWLDRCFYAQDLAEYTRTVERFVDAARRARCTPVLCLEPLAVAPCDGEDAWWSRAGPLRQYFPSGAVFGEVYGRYGAALREVAERRGAIFIDAQGELPRSPGMFADMVHLTDQGSAVFAEYLAHKLIDYAVGTMLPAVACEPSAGGAPPRQ